MLWGLVTEAAARFKAAGALDDHDTAIHFTTGLIGIPGAGAAAAVLDGNDEAGAAHAADAAVAVAAV